MFGVYFTYLTDGDRLFYRFNYCAVLQSTWEQIPGKFINILSNIIFYIILITHARYVVIGTDAFLEQPVANFPREYGRTFAFVLRYLGNHFGRCHPGLGSAYRPRPDGTGLIIPIQEISVT